MLLFRKCLIIFIMIFSIGTFKQVLASPPSSEIEKIKLEAPVHLIGEVIADELIKDLSKEKGTNYQIRKMTLKVKSFIKNTSNEPNEMDVYYSYIPSWQADQWEGGKRVDIAVMDEIEIWLEEGEYGLEPALGGFTVIHHKYANDRKEPLKEPITYFLLRKLEDVLSNHTSLLVFFSLSILLSIILSIPYMKKSFHKIE